MIVLWPCRYDVAISTACAALNYIVVETASDAQRCVELLRRRSLGVATFLILEKQKGLAGQMNEAVQTPEGERWHTKTFPNRVLCAWTSAVLW
jgi:structural maintenance of chromosome 4